ncbi:peptidylprolyl isomerase [Ramlibacter solisilvae]|uniref:peptidylprolyl isomerase n=1 Tax=Ramlibacter tataouinensis TaxID=94132 RepID=A0A127JY01_9BURK|nr:peptidylprolyl isomerase [Ramlibacter tataouinensis]AMO24775.1 peptidylprolyl isomerase [Ramlibacter tataouinensis]
MNHVRGSCGSGGVCSCAGQAQPPVASINGIALHEPGQHPGEYELKERAWTELLRQQAVRQGLLAHRHVLTAPALAAHEQQAIERMLDEAVPVPAPGELECRRYYQSVKPRFVEGRQVHLRHILFAVTEGVDVHRLAVKAEQVLLELMRKDVPPGRFAERARELSNCPSGAAGGDLGWIGPQDCAEELANELFLQKNPLHGMGLRPRLVHSRYGLHIVEVLGRKQGRQPAFDEVRPRIELELAQRSRATALHQYVRLLAGRSRVEGVDLEAAATPLVQ